MSYKQAEVAAQATANDLFNKKHFEKQKSYNDEFPINANNSNFFETMSLNLLDEDIVQHTLKNIYVLYSFDSSGISGIGNYSVQCPVACPEGFRHQYTGLDTQTMSPIKGKLM